MSRVPAEPGTKPVPTGTIRFYHYTNAGEAALRSIAQHGIKVSESKGHTYGEPNVVWASTERPRDGKWFVEFWAKPDEPCIGEPWNTPKGGWTEANLRDWESKRSNVAFCMDIPPSRIIGVHEPWHSVYHRLETDPRKVDDLNRYPDFRTGNDEDTDKGVAEWFKDHPERDEHRGRARRRKRAPSRPAWTGRPR